MGLFKRIFARKSAMCICEERSAMKTLTLPNGRKVNVCSECEKEKQEFMARPINSTQFEAILKGIHVNKTGIWNIPWGTTPEEMINNSNPEIAEQLRSSKSPHLMSYFAKVEVCTETLTEGVH
ncbi:MAG: hypothetical protein GTO17_01725 [Candidatus Aminicenantes bacterium]|nr:hypothetical protein [Candidatus Aminicenantes bacterium]